MFSNKKNKIIEELGDRVKELESLNMELTKQLTYNNVSEKRFQKLEEENNNYKEWIFKILNESKKISVETKDEFVIPVLETIKPYQPEDKYFHMRRIETIIPAIRIVKMVQE